MTSSQSWGEGSSHLHFNSHHTLDRSEQPNSTTLYHSVSHSQPSLSNTKPDQEYTQSILTLPTSCPHTTQDVEGGSALLPEIIRKLSLSLSLSPAASAIGIFFSPTPNVHTPIHDRSSSSDELHTKTGRVASSTDQQSRQLGCFKRSEVFLILFYFILFSRRRHTSTHTHIHAGHMREIDNVITRIRGGRPRCGGEGGGGSRARWIGLAR